MQNLEEQIKLLVETQGLDTRILRLEGQLEEIPQVMKKMEEDFKEGTATLKALEDGVKTLQLKRKEKEGDLEAKEGNIKKYQSQLNQVKTNKEYSTLQEEVGRIKADNSLIEEDILNIFDQIDVENKKIVKEKEVLKEKEARLGEEKKKLAAEGEGIKKELEGLQGQRSTLSAKIDKTILAKYERILKNKGGLAVVPIINDACQGCFRVMPPQVVSEVAVRQELISCEYCARILYIEG